MDGMKRNTILALLQAGRPDLANVIAAVPTAPMKSAVYYHGTPNEAAAKKILREGIRAPELKHSRGLMTPIKGRVYITPSLQYAAIYALGANILGSKNPPDWLWKKSRYGYVFEIVGKDLVDVQPDEDSVGELVMRLMSGKQTEPAWLLGLARVALTPKQYKKINDGEYAYFASGGKRLLKAMSDAQKLELLKLEGVHVAHAGDIKPQRAWRLDKKQVGKLKPDGSNFFQVAKQVK